MNVDERIDKLNDSLSSLESEKDELVCRALFKGVTGCVELVDKGIKWVGEIPSHWTVEKGKFLFVLRDEKGGDNPQLLSPTQKYGVIPQSLYEQLTGMVTVKVNEKTDLQSFKTIKVGDFCISLRSFEGGFEFSQYNGVVSPAYTVFYGNDRLYNDYYKFLFKSKPFIDEMNSYSLSLRDGKPISFTNFGNTLLPVPPIEEQIAIAEYLNKKCAEIDDVIADIKTQIETLKQSKKSLITQAVSRGLVDGVEMKDSGIQWVGLIPAHWSVLRAKYLFTNGKQIVGKDVEDYERLALTMNGVIKRSKEDANGLQPEKFDTYQILREGELVFKLIDLQNVTTSRVGLSPYTGIVSPAYIILKAGEKINPSYAEKYYLSMWMNEIFNYLGDAGVRSSLNATELLEIAVPVPPIEEQIAIAEYLNKKCAEIDDVIADKEEQLEVLESYKKSLIFEIVTGKRGV